MQDEDTAIDDALTRDGDLHQGVDRLVEAGVGVDIPPEASTDALEEVDDPLAGEVLRAIEGDVFEEVGEAPLALLFLHRSDLLSDVEFCSALRLFVVADEVGKTIGELTDTHRCVDGQGGHPAWSLSLGLRSKPKGRAQEERREDG